MKSNLMRRVLRYVIVTSLAFACLTPLSAQISAGATFLRMNIGSHAQGMGNAYTAIAASTNGMHYNPAGMGFGSDREVMFFHSKWFQDISVENVTFMYPFTTRWSLGTSISYLHMPELTRYEIDPASGGPLETGKFRVYNMIAMAGVGFRVSDHMSLGTNVKFFQEQLESVTAEGVAFDVGLLTRVPNTGLRFGAAVQHIGPPVKYIEKSEVLPMTYKAGMALKFAGNSTVAVDVAKTVGKEVEVLPGLELGLSDNFFMRGGYQFSNNPTESSGFAAGFGLELLDEHRINYVYVPYGDLGDTHRAEVVFHLGSASSGKSRYGEVNSVSAPTNNRARDIINAPAEKTASSDIPGSGSVRRADKAAQSRSAATNPLPPAETPNVIDLDNDPNFRPAPPTGMGLTMLDGGKMKLTWDASLRRNIAYHIYARPIDGSKWIRVTREPVAHNYQVFAQTKSGVSLMFVTTAVFNDQESDFSEPVSLDSRPAPKAAAQPAATNTNRPAPVRNNPPATARSNSAANRPEPPAQVHLQKLPDRRVRLYWNTVDEAGVSYHIYARALDGNKWIRITPEPTRDSFRIFNTRQSDKTLLMVVTAVRGNEESDFSEPVYLNQ